MLFPSDVNISAHDCIPTVPRLIRPRSATNHVVSVHFGTIFLLVLTLLLIPKGSILDSLRVNCPTVALFILAILCMVSLRILSELMFPTYHPLVSSTLGSSLRVTIIFLNWFYFCSFKFVLSLTLHQHGLVSVATLQYQLIKQKRTMICED